MTHPESCLKIKREGASCRPVSERVRDYREVMVPPRAVKSREQACRCMDCRTPFCHWGCPAGSHIPEWTNSMREGNWKHAYRLLQSANNFPEITGRLCPALCEDACVLGLHEEPVAVRENELAVIERAFKSGFVRPCLPGKRTGKRIAIVGSGPAGLAAADELNKTGHEITVFEKNDKIGGAMRYGIPDFKLEKRILDRRIEILAEEGIRFRTNVEAGGNCRIGEIKNDFDAICLAAGCRVPRDLEIPGRGLKGIHFAMDYLVQANRRVGGENIPPDELIDAESKKVVIIGGGDTGADCMGTAHRQKAARVTQIELFPRPPVTRTEECPWPGRPVLLKNSSSHLEGGRRMWQVITKKFIGENGRLKKLLCAKAVCRLDSNGRPVMKEMPSTEFEIEADMAVLAIGFLRTEYKGMTGDPMIELDEKGNFKTDETFMTCDRGVFAAGDMRTGQSFIIRAVAEGRRCARRIDRFLAEDGKIAFEKGGEGKTG